MRVIWSLAVLIGCGYHAGSFAALGHDFAGRRLALGCVDLAIDRKPDGPLGTVIAYDVGNSCDQSVSIDLGAIVVIGRTDHAEIELKAYDPRGELTRLPLDGRAVATETIEYRARVPVAFLDVCVEATRIVGAAGPWQCLGPAPAEAPR